MNAGILLIAASLGLSTASAVFAQTPSPPPPPPPDTKRHGGMFEYNRFNDQLLDRELADQRFKMAAFQGARSKDIDRANRVASLIDNGRCEAAHQLALAEGDRRMAGRATRICNERAARR